MPSDYGDEAGEKLFDWMLKLGQEGGEALMVSSAKRLKEALRNAMGTIASSGAEAAGWAKLRMDEFEELPEYDTIKEIIGRKLDEEKVQHRFYRDRDGHDRLLFRTADAPDVLRAFEELGIAADAALERADGDPRVGKGRGVDLNAPATDKQMGFLDSLRKKGVVPEEDYQRVIADGPTVGAVNDLLNKHARHLDLRDGEPLEERASRARRAAKAIEGTARAEREIPLCESRAK